MTVYRLDEQAPPVCDPFDLEQDPSLNGQEAASQSLTIAADEAALTRLFLGRYGIGYIARHFASRRLKLHVLTHPRETDTCFEKAELLGAWDPINVVKALYFEHSCDGLLYAVVIPETGCFVDRVRLKRVLELPGDGFLRKAEHLPRNMDFGTCSPFITAGDMATRGGRVMRIVFDSEALAMKRADGTHDDFSFGLDHRMSMQMNYTHCYEMLRALFPAVVEEREVLHLSFQEKLVRTQGRIHISYDFRSLNYGTARFINSIHGYGDVLVLNDRLDELDLPRVISEPRPVSDPITPRSP